MAYEQRDSDIAVFKAKERKTDKSPHWTGTAVLDGKKYDVVFWEKGNSGTMLAGAIKPADDATFQRGGGADTRTGGSAGLSGGGREPAPALDDEIPFASNDSIW